MSVVVVVVVVSAAFSSFVRLHLRVQNVSAFHTSLPTLPSSVVSCFCFSISSRPETSSI
jgi:hypothetical protein